MAGGHPFGSSRVARGRYLALSAGCFLAGLVLFGVAVWSRPGQWIDGRANAIILEAIPSPVREALADLAREGAVPVLAALAAGVMLLGAAHGERVRVLMAVLIPAAAVPTSLWLRDSAISRPDLGVAGYTQNTFPSVHAAAAFALMAVIALLWPGPRRRWHTVALLVMGMAVGLGNVTGHDHRPVDVVGSLLLVLGVTFLWMAITPAPRARKPDFRDEVRAPMPGLSR